MPNLRKVREATHDAAQDNNHRFDELVRHLCSTGWSLRVKGSHHILSHPSCPYLLNLQPEGGGKAKGYQVRQIRRVLVQF
jgi:hypothetical protein